MKFAGANYDPEFDAERLEKQIGRVFECMRDGNWRTLQEVHVVTLDPEASISAQLRHLRKDKFGNYVIERRHRGDRARGLYEYRLLKPVPPIQLLFDEKGQGVFGY